MGLSLLTEDLFGPYFRELSRKGGQGKTAILPILILVSLALIFFKDPESAFADSSNGLNPGNQTPFMPMMGNFGGSKKAFSPIRSGILRYPGQGHQVAANESDCTRFHYNSNPPSSGLLIDRYISGNDRTLSALSPCVIVNVIHRGNIVLFYDPSRLSPQTVSEIREIGSSDQPPDGFNQQQRLGYAVILVKARFKDPIVLLAWRRILPLKFLDRMKTNTFLSRYRGQIARKR